MVPPFTVYDKFKTEFGLRAWKNKTRLRFYIACYFCVAVHSFTCVRQMKGDTFQTQHVNAYILEETTIFGDILHEDLFQTEASTHQSPFLVSPTLGVA